MADESTAAIAEPVPAPKSLFVDSSVYIKVLLGEKPQDRLDASVAALRRVSDRACRTWGNYLIYAEVFGRGEARQPRSTAVTEQVDRWFRQGLLYMAEVDSRIAEHARVVAAEHRLRGADAIHLATALLVGCDFFFTWDEDFPVGERIDGRLQVSHPFAWGQGQLGDVNT